MKDQIDKSTDIMLGYYGDAASREFYAFLRERRFRTTRCDDCGETPFPPRTFCPNCFSHKTQWVDLPTVATLYAFTQQDRSLRFPKPEVIGLVELEGVGVILSHIRAPFESLVIGQPLALDFVEISPTLVLHCFKPE
jgi:uncharacterized protein